MVIRHILLALIASALSACDVVSTSYPNRGEATANGQIANGWLPEIIPSSATEIETNNDLDLNVSWGKFKYAKANHREFFAQLSLPSRTSPFENWQETLAEHQARGFEIGEYAEVQQVWVFFCSKAVAKCEYRMWLERRNG
ncbi:MAG: hypothetical protein H6953_02790 [Chromatiaceae bacterium]|nr:hypothetical protein [Chromatiaceae bacterium]MCP5314078.1 hypothetical protein [Chromatiaceae bacterium]